MNPLTDLPSIDWARRVNRSWIVRGHLNEHAETWLDHLAAKGDGRLESACSTARAMCALRDRLDDPKPWFYAGLFSPATRDEALRFIATHHVTKAAIPAMTDDPEVILWLAHTGPETHDLITRLRHALAHVPAGKTAV
jgi:hypothetical protein